MLDAVDHVQRSVLICVVDQRPGLLSPPTFRILHCWQREGSTKINEFSDPLLETIMDFKFCFRRPVRSRSMAHGDLYPESTRFLIFCT